MKLKCIKGSIGLNGEVFGCGDTFEASDDDGNRVVGSGFAEIVGDDVPSGEGGGEKVQSDDAGDASTNAKPTKRNARR